MKVLQYAACSFFLTLAAVSQTASPAPASPAPAPSSGASKPMQLSTLGGDQISGPAHPLTLDQMKELFSLMGYDKLLEQNRVQMIALQKQRAPFIPQDFWDDLQAGFQKIDYPTAVLDVYKKYISTEDAAKVIEFSKTEAGKHFLENVPALSSGTAQAIQKAQQQVGQDVQAKHKDELEAAIKKHQEESQKPAPSLGPTGPSGSSAPSGSSSTPPPSTPPASTPPKN